MNKENYLSEAALREQPSKRIYLKIRDGSITTDKIADGAVTTPKIEDKAITSAKLSEDAYSSISATMNGHYLPITGGSLEAGSSIFIMSSAMPYRNTTLSSSGLYMEYNGGREAMAISGTNLVLYYIGSDDYHRLLNIDKNGIYYQIDKSNKGTDWKDKIRINEDGITVHEGSITAEKDDFYTKVSSDSITMSDSSESLFTTATTITKERITMASGIGITSTLSISPNSLSMTSYNKGGETIYSNIIDSKGVTAEAFIKRGGNAAQLLRADGSVMLYQSILNGKCFHINDTYNTNAGYAYGNILLGHNAPGTFHLSIELNGGTGNVTAGGFIKDGASSREALMGDGSTKAVGSANGIASLDASGNVPLSQLRNVDTTLLIVVKELPTTGIKSNKIYLVPSTSSEENNTYAEYVYVNSKWEKLGEYKPDVSLDDYISVHDTKESKLSKHTQGDNDDSWMLCSKEGDLKYIPANNLEVYKAQRAVCDGYGKRINVNDYLQYGTNDNRYYVVLNNKKDAVIIAAMYDSNPSLSFKLASGGNQHWISYKGLNFDNNKKQVLSCGESKLDVGVTSDETAYTALAPLDSSGKIPLSYIPTLSYDKLSEEDINKIVAKVLEQIPVMQNEDIDSSTSTE